MRSALHVGAGASGGSQTLTDAGVVRHRDGRPFVPGSSLKGVLRSHLERLAQAPGLRAAEIRSCGLYGGLDETCPTPGWIESGADATQATERDFARLCHTCTLFGSPILAGKVRIPDLEVDPDSFAGAFEIRDGVGIDRDRGQAVEKIKFDYEVVPSDTIFYFELSADSPDSVELALLSVAVREMQNGQVAIGGKTTRGLGACVLEAVSIYDANLSDPEGLKAYLTRRAAEPVKDPEAFLDEAIEALFL